MDMDTDSNTDTNTDMRHDICNKTREQSWQDTEKISI